VTSCPVCGLSLPPHANFCAWCGSPLPRAGRVAAPAWLLVLFWIGTALAAAGAVIYTVIAFSPDVPAQTPGGPDARAGAVVLAIVAGALACVQLPAVIGLTAGRSWARPLATVVCIVWSLTCIGLPLSLLALNTIWRSTPPGGPSPRSGGG
jgi:hypothetical protein